MDSKRTTLRDVASKLGISHTTVALALRDHYRISVKRREEVKRVAEEMGYQPDPFLSGLAAYRRRHGSASFQGVIGWINHWSQPTRLRKYREFDAYWEGAKVAAKRYGYRLEEVQWPDDCSAKRFEQVLRARGIMGLLIPPHKPTVDWGDFDWHKFSLIRFGMSVRNPDANVVTSDQQRAAVMAIQRIHEYGYQRIGFIGDALFELSLGGNYFGGFCWAQRMLHLDPALPPYVWANEVFRTDPEKAAPTLKHWLSRYKPDAILTPSEETIAIIRLLGYRIPKDIAVAGTSVLDLPVDAGIDQHSNKIGQIAVEMLVKQINFSDRGEPSDPCRILVEGTWQDGKSLPRRR
jgi:DNA-binding LacI/PurR family transcriptional regulator